ALERAGLATHLHFVIDSSVVKVSKPDPHIFELGLEAAGTRPDATVYIGDSYFVDVVAARQAGLGAVLFDPGRVSDARDCVVAARLDDAVALALGGTRSNRGPPFQSGPLRNPPSPLRSFSATVRPTIASRCGGTPAPRRRGTTGPGPSCTSTSPVSASAGSSTWCSSRT